MADKTDYPEWKCLDCGKELYRSDIYYKEYDDEPEDNPMLCGFCKSSNVVDKFAYERILRKANKLLKRR